MKLKVSLQSLADAERFGYVFGSMAEKGSVVLLIGDLGAGKTTLTRFIAWGLGVPRDTYITSPSFSLMNQYYGRIPLYHIDCYRLEDEDDVEESGLIDYIVADGLTVIEWPDRLGSLLPDNRIEIEMTAGEQKEERHVTVTVHGDGWQHTLHALHDAFPGTVIEAGI